MMSLGSGRRANSSPSSHLSPAAAPFTAYEWQNSHLPPPKPDSVTASPATMSLPRLDAYRFSSSAKWSAGCGTDAADPFVSYGLPLDSIESLFCEDEGPRLSSRLSTTTSSRSLLGPQWVDNLGLDDAKLAKRSEFDGKLSAGNQYTGGLNGYDSHPYKSLNPVYGHAGCSSSIGYTKGHGLSLYPESGWMEKDLPSYQKTRGPYEKLLMPSIAKTTLPGCASLPAAADSSLWRGSPSPRFPKFDYPKFYNKAGDDDVSMDKYSDSLYEEHLQTRKMGDENEFGKNRVTVSTGNPTETVRLTGEKISVAPTAVVNGVDLRGEDSAEKVCAPSSSQEDSEMDVSEIVKKIHSLSELLRVRISSDVCSLGEEKSETLKHVLTNLNTCLSKEDVQSEARPKDDLGETLSVLDESPIKGVISGGSRTKCDSSCFNEDQINFFDKNYETSTLSDNLAKDDDMAKAIQNVLEQNFLTKEDMHSEALLFKSMWLESEAKLCSTRCKARFEQMRIQIEEIKLTKANELPEMFGGDLADSTIVVDDKTALPIINEEFVDGVLDVSSDSLVCAVIDSYFERAECQSPIVSNDSAVRSIESNDGVIDCSTEWEHVLEEDIL